MDGFRTDWNMDGLRCEGLGVHYWGKPNFFYFGAFLLRILNT